MKEGKGLSSRPWFSIHSLVMIAQLLLCNRETLPCHSQVQVDNDMKRILKKDFKSEKSSLGSIQGPATLTSTSTGATDFMLSRAIPIICDSESDGTSSTQVAAGISVSVQLSPSHLF